MAEMRGRLCRSFAVPQSDRFVASVCVASDLS